MEIIFKCDIPLCYDSTIYKICISQKNTSIFRQQNLCALQSDMIRPRIYHSQAQVNS
jgi:hypothetical protein